jgi:outer membrane beta-barrel protein
METRARVLLLTVLLLPLAGCASLQWPWSRDRDRAQGFHGFRGRGGGPPPASSSRWSRKVKVAAIDAGTSGRAWLGHCRSGFGTNNVYGVRAAYHVTEDFFFEANVGKSKAGQTSYETLGGNVQLLTPDERRFTYYSLSLGYNLLPGEVYIGRGLAMNSALYLLGGIGSTKFAGDQHFTVNFGAGYRVLPTDWLAIHIDVQDLVFQSDLLGKDKLTNNIGAYIGA